MTAPDDRVEPSADETRPSIVVTNRPLREISADAVEALYKANDPPVIFARGDSLVRVERSRDGSGRVVTLGEDHLRGRLTRAADFLRVVKRRGWDEHGHVSPPSYVVRDVLTTEDLSFPHLNGVVSSPVVRPDGSILDRPGFDISTGLYYVHAPGFVMPSIPAQPSSLDVAVAVEGLRDVFADFPFADAASLASAMAFLMTPMVRPMIAGPTPLALVDSPQAGTGKGLLVEVASIIATGGTAAVTTAPRGDDEMRKRITSALLGGQAVILFDNVEGTLQAPSLAAAITATMWQDRYLGQNRQITVPVLASWVATGNNLRLGGDLARRSHWTRIDARTARPWQRTAFRHEDLIEYVRRERPRLVAHLLTLIQAWVAAGRPRPSVNPLGSFREWTCICGGILEMAGVDGFLGNLDRMYEQADVETPAWTAFLEAWRAYFGDRDVTAAAVIEATAGTMTTQIELRDALPDEVTEGKTEHRSRALGRALAAREERRFGDRDLRIIRARTAHRAVCWRVVEG